MNRKYFVAFLFLTLLPACQTSPTGRHQFVAVSESEVESSGVAAFNEMKTKTPADTDAAENAYVKCVANALTSAMDQKQSWEVVVFKSEEVNAFALPGGKIGVYQGLLKVATTQSQLAAVIGHEVGHVIAQHGRERISQQMATQSILQFSSLMLSNKEGPGYSLAMAGLGLGAQVGVLLPFSRIQESEADVIGLQLMAKAGFDPHEAITLWQNMSKSGGSQPPVLLSDHPSNSSRMKELSAHMSEAESLQRASGRHPQCGH